MEPPEPVAVEESERQALPTGYLLSQNHPNPFNPITTIAYDLPKASDVSLAIYTITGQKVAIFVDGHQQAGHHTATFDGSGFANGVYLYRLEAGSFVETRRMLLLQ
jgi:glucuronoarabinoxylan endo-1,4-beta-xylanase